jgi:hypothetical protein
MATVPEAGRAPPPKPRLSAPHAFLIAVVLALLLFGVGWAFIQSAASPPSHAAPTKAASPLAQPRPEGKVANAPVANRPAQAAAADPDTAWQAVERIDAKIANTLIWITVFITLIVVLLGLYEFVKLRELDEIEKKMEKMVTTQVERQFFGFKKDYEKQLAVEHLSAIRQMTAEVADDQLQLAATGHRVLLSYVINDLPGRATDMISVKSMRCYIEIQRALANLRIAADQDNLAGLTTLLSTSETVGPSTSAALLQYLFEVRRMRLLSNWTNQALCDKIISGLEKRTGISSEAVEAATAR